MTRLPAGQRWGLLTACALAGALAVPLHPVATPAAAALFALLATVGSWAWRWSHLPELLHDGQDGASKRLSRAGAWIALGFAVGLALLAVIRIVLEPDLPAIGDRIAAAGRMSIWRRILIIYVAAVTEELLFRVLLLSLLAGLAARLFRLRNRVPNAAALWSANIASALAFGAAHLPAWAAGPANPWLRVSVLTLNALGGLVLGYVFATRGVLPAMCTHAGADCAIQLLGPLTT